MDFPTVVGVPRLIYVAAWGRSGSTILGNILGTLPGVFDAGELRQFWSRMEREDHLCGCGEMGATCGFWSEVRAALLSDDELPTRELDDVRRWQREAIRARRTMLVVRAQSIAELPPTPFGGFVTALRCLYRAIARVSGAGVVVDSSKKVSYAALARFASNESPRFVHLIRDPRAVAHSWQRVKDATLSGARQMPRHGPVGSSINWVSSNLGADMVRRRAPETSTFLRYEDLVRAPRETLYRLIEGLGRDPSEVPFVDDHTVDLPRNHAFAGNPSRFAHGRVRLSEDDAWMREQKRTDRLACEAITLPFLRRYGYRLRVDEANATTAALTAGMSQLAELPPPSAFETTEAELPTTEPATEPVIRLEEIEEVDAERGR